MDHLVFVYGSLMDPAARRETLAHRTSSPAVEPLVVEGWERAWNCLSARTFEVVGAPEGQRFRRLVLGIRPRAGARCEGLVLRVDDRDLAALRRREAAYALTDLSPAAPGGERVVGFVPRPQRTDGLVEVDEPLVVERAYLDRCRSGARRHHLAEAAEELERALGRLRVVDPVPDT
ncbi:MAG: gamma-glutamylcyclotransferase [Acidimicrobiales bacterium]|nr:gamma-glutamylcyclotransferase [Acidimicrobiales bacterium]